MSDTTPKKRGAPLGNQNARKHGYYSRFVSIGREKYYLRPSVSLDIDTQIEFAIAKVRSIHAVDPVNVRLLERARGTLRRLNRERAKVKGCDITPTSQKAQGQPTSRHGEKE